MEPANIIPTILVKLKKGGQELRINNEDFDSSLHERLEPATEAHAEDQAGEDDSKKDRKHKRDRL